MLVVMGLVGFISTALKAVQLLEELGGSRTLSQFHFGRLLLWNRATSRLWNEATSTL
jgi:hypothetical protein